VRQVAATVINPVTHGALWGTNAYFWDPSKKNAMSHRWNFDIQRELNPDLILTVAYVGALEGGWISTWRRTRRPHRDLVQQRT